jgi:hypothetical protein
VTAVEYVKAAIGKADCAACLALMSRKVLCLINGYDLSFGAGEMLHFMPSPLS